MDDTTTFPPSEVKTQHSCDELDLHLSLNHMQSSAINHDVWPHIYIYLIKTNRFKSTLEFESAWKNDRNHPWENFFLKNAFCFNFVLPEIMMEEGIRTYNGTGHQGAVEMLHF